MTVPFLSEHHSYGDFSVDDLSRLVMALLVVVHVDWCNGGWSLTGKDRGVWRGPDPPNFGIFPLQPIMIKLIYYLCNQRKNDTPIEICPP
jgi:hypothetical protein